MILLGDCLEQMQTLVPNSVDAVVTDPPYGLSFMGKKWDYDVPSVDIWREVLRVLKPGGHVLSFGGTRTYHRMVVNMEDAGFEIRDQVAWLYGQGFPKSTNVLKSGIKQGLFCGCKTLSESQMPTLCDSDLQEAVSSSETENDFVQSSVSEQSLSCPVLRTQSKKRTSNGEKSSLEGRSDLQANQGELHRSEVCSMSEGISSDGPQRQLHNGASVSNGETSGSTSQSDGSSSSQRSQYSKQSNSQSRAVPEQRSTQACGSCGKTEIDPGLGSALKPSIEPICLARKPLEKGLTLAQNVLKWGTGGLNIDGTRIGFSSESDKESAKPQGNMIGVKIYNAGHSLNHAKTENTGFVQNTQGRWPANVLFEGFDEQVLILRDNLPVPVYTLIKEFYASYSEMPSLQSQHANLPESQKSQEVLQSEMLCESTNQATGTDDGQAPHTRSNSSNEDREKENCEEGTRQSNLEGSLVLPGLSACEYNNVIQDEAQNTGADAAQGPRLSAGTSNNDGVETAPPTTTLRISSPQKRDQRRQSNRKSRASLEQPPQKGALASVNGSPQAACLVRESDVPQVWLQYFESSGLEVASKHSAAAVLDEQTKDQRASKPRGGNSVNRTFNKAIYNLGLNNCTTDGEQFNDSGGASRFFYVAKASKRERNTGLEGMPIHEGVRHLDGGEWTENKTAKSGEQKRLPTANHHPTVKPTKLMEYLITLITPPNGTVLDPFMGSGSTGVAAKNLGREFIGIEMNAEYFELAKRRIESAT